jgi:cytochrome c556
MHSDPEGGTVTDTILRRIAMALTTTALLAAGSATAQPASKAEEGALKYRQALMESIGGDMAALSDLLKYGLSHPGHAAVHADGLASHAKLVIAAFETKVVDGPTDAEPAIWEKPDEYKEKVKAFETETAKLAEVAKSGDAAALGVQLKATGKACGGCHDSFRKPKEESFKRKGGGGDDED